MTPFVMYLRKLTVSPMLEDFILGVIQCMTPFVIYLRKFGDKNAVFILVGRNWVPIKG
jgi:hypothetical protein